jgi:Holliday junction resolvasome RuvABC endonuclease subunit
MIVAGIDPGLAGAFCIMDHDHVLALDHLPTHKTQRSSSAKVRAELDLHALRDVLIEHNVTTVVIEAVAAMPRQGVTSTFRFGTAYGQLVGLTIGLGLSLTLVRPQLWQRHHGVGGAPDAARQRALELCPNLSKQLARTKDCHRSDALLLAVYSQSLLHHDANHARVPNLDVDARHA